MNLRCLFILFFVCSNAVLFTSAGQELPDSVRYSEPTDSHLRPAELIVPGALVFAGAVGIGQEWKIMNHEHTVSKLAMEGSRIVPIAGFLCLDFTGVKAKHCFADRLMMQLTSFAIMTGLVEGLKHVVREERPNKRNFHSFPSGHTATAFMTAELLRMEYGTWVGLAGYFAAGCTGYFRMRAGKHFLNDVLAGAGIGFFSARAAKWLLPLEQKLLGWDKESPVRAVVVPQYEPYGKSVGATLCLSF